MSDQNFLKVLANSGSPVSVTLLLREIVLAVKSLDAAVRMQNELCKPRKRGRPKKSESFRYNESNREKRPGTS